VTIAKRPSVLGRDGEDEEVIWVKSEPKYFCEGGWTGNGDTARRAKSTVRPDAFATLPQGFGYFNNY
jgi:hypothetical protein